MSFNKNNKKLFQNKRQTKSIHKHLQIARFLMLIRKTFLFVVQIQLFFKILLKIFFKKQQILSAYVHIKNNEYKIMIG